MPTYSLTLRSQSDHKLTIEELDNNFLYLQQQVGTFSGITEDITIDGQLLSFVNGILVGHQFLVSDISLKENIQFIGKSPKGINIYNFNYKGDSILYQGVIANELIGTEFESAVIMGDTLKVNYSLIDVLFKKID
jgi:hypothetical protein